jgi:hypothetical protein
MLAGGNKNHALLENATFRRENGARYGIFKWFGDPRILQSCNKVKRKE